MGKDLKKTRKTMNRQNRTINSDVESYKEGPAEKYNHWNENFTRTDKQQMWLGNRDSKPVNRTTGIIQCE